MRKFACLLLVLLCVPAFSLAQEDLSDYAIADGNVAAVHFIDLTAPASGTLLPFDLEAGDTVTRDQILFSLQTVKIRAPEDGVCSAVFAAAGDDAAAVLSRYGTLAGLEPAVALRVNATTAGAYNDEKNRTLHLGEKLHFKSTKSGHTEGSGIVSAVSGTGYRVDVTDGSFDRGETLTLYRGDDDDSQNNVGKGTVERRDSPVIAGAGRIVKAGVASGDAVRAGQTLFELLAADADPEASPDISCPEDGVVLSVGVAPGQQVWKGQVLARIGLAGDLEVVAEADETDLNRLRVGDTLPVTLDTDESAVLHGTVTEISALGVTRQNAAYFAVHVALDGEKARIGQSASVYLPKEEQ